MNQTTEMSAEVDEAMDTHVEKELKWGKFFRFNKTQEVCFERAMKRLLKKRRRKRRRKELKLKHLICVCPQDEVKTRKKRKKECTYSPRYSQLAVPKKADVFCTWRDYAGVLDPDKILFLQDILEKKEAITPIDAKNYFSRLDEKRRKKIRRLQKKKLKADIIPKPQLRIVCKIADSFVDDILKYYLKPPLAATNLKSRLISEELLNRMKKIESMDKKKSQRPFMTGVRDILDQLAVWLDKNVNFSHMFSYPKYMPPKIHMQYPQFIPADVDLVLDDMLLTSVITEKPEEAEAAQAEAEAEESEEEGEVQEALEVVLEEEEEEEGEGEGGEAEDQEVKKEIEDGQAIDDSELEEKGEVEELSLDDKLEAEPLEAGDAEDEIVDSYVVVQKPEESESFDTVLEREFVDGEEEPIPPPLDVEAIVIEEIEAMAEAEEGIAEVPVSPAEVEEIVPETEEIPDLFGLLMDAFLDEVDRMEMEGPEMEEMEEYEEFPEEFAEEEVPGVEEHVPGTVCCMCMKTWASWLVDVTQNNNAWCEWIQHTAAQIKRYTSILRGGVVADDGKPEVVYREEWLIFKEAVERELKSWEEYNAEVMKYSKSIINNFEGKKVPVCPLCVKSKMIVNEETARKVNKQLVDALKTTAVWRQSINDAMMRTGRLSSFDIDLTEYMEPKPKRQPFISEAYMPVLEEQSHAPHGTVSEESVYVLEEQ